MEWKFKLLFNLFIMIVRAKVSHAEWLKYMTPGACAFDFRTVESVTILPGEFKLIDTGTVIETPEGYVLLTAPRSSIFKNYWLMQVNSIWIIDQDYCWNTDTIKFPYINMRKESVTINAWERIWQWMFVKIEKPEFEIVTDMWNEERWGFWTTGIK